MFFVPTLFCNCYNHAHCNNVNSLIESVIVLNLATKNIYAHILLKISQDGGNTNAKYIFLHSKSKIFWCHAISDYAGKFPLPPFSDKSV